MARSSEADQLRAKIGATIKAARQNAGLPNQGALGELVDAAQTTVSRWERGASDDVLTLDDVLAVEDALQLDRGQLLAAAGYVPDVTTTEQAILIDPAITDPLDRQALLALYRVFLARRAD